MTVVIEDIPQINLVLVGVSLIKTTEETAAFRQGVGTEVATAEAGMGSEVINRTHTLNRDRITITWAADRSTIARQYPAESDLQRLAQVAWLAIENTDLKGQVLRAYGYNIELIYEPNPEESAIRYLSERLFMPQLLQTGGWQLYGGTGRLFFEKEGRYWQTTLEPRFNDETTSKIFTSINLHRAEAGLHLPRQEEIEDDLKLLWEEAHNLVNQLHGSIKR